MLIFTTCSLLMTVEICIPYLSSERIDSKAVFIRSLTTCQHSAQLTAFYLTVKYHQKKPTKDTIKTYLQKRSVNIILSYARTGTVWKLPQQ